MVYLTQPRERGRDRFRSLVHCAHFVAEDAARMQAGKYQNFLLRKTFVSTRYPLSGADIGNFQRLKNENMEAEHIDTSALLN